VKRHTVRVSIPATLCFSVEVPADADQAAIAAAALAVAVEGASGVEVDGYPAITCGDPILYPDDDLTSETVTELDRSPLCSGCGNVAEDCDQDYCREDCDCPPEAAPATDVPA
jgi:hypothetical protein